MKIIVSILFLVGLLLGCSNTTSEAKTSSDRSTASQEKKKTYTEITLRENGIDTFQLPFPEREILDDLEKFYSPFKVKRQIGQQDGPDFEFISISKDTIPVVYIRFDPDQRLRLDQIVILDSSAVDEYGVRVGDSYAELKEKRQIEFQNQTDFHQHTYLFNETSNIYYEIFGDLGESQIEDIENLQLTDDQLQTWTVDKILWRK